ncbi:MAG TPA: hypothetical protein VEU53_09915 [Stellaceae bacterium]|nr:hypothetical protein [Stellaceae bacterium]
MNWLVGEQKMPAIGISIARLNRLNRRFWRKRAKRMEQRLGDVAIRETAFALIRSEHQRGVPLFHQISVDLALEQAAHASDRFIKASDSYERFIKERAREAGKAKKTDALQMAIEALVRQDPRITEPQLRTKLTREQWPDVIEDVDDEVIAFKDRHGRGKEAKLSGLKDRLSRARMKVRSR